MAALSKKQSPVFIAGPCSVESREQLWILAQSFQHLHIDFFRAGVWKPRTRPGSFEGLGEKALIWLREMKETFHIPVVVEVASVQHIELALKYGIDGLWIGARTTVNPFHVQQLADALHGVDISVLIKNPVIPDVALWQGAIERFERAGIQSIGAIHRGFSSYRASSPYRNPPDWIVPIELKRRRPDIPIICDPSHITGRRDMIEPIAQKALDMGFDGLMIETHPDPDKALSDAEQQITPEAFIQLMQALQIRNKNLKNIQKAAELEYLRQIMDQVDNEIIDLLARRMELAIRMGEIKKSFNMAAYSPERWDEILASRTRHGSNQGLDAEYIADLYEKIHHESIKKQIDLLGSKERPPNCPE